MARDSDQSRLPASEEVLRALRERIITGELRPGTRLIDSAVAEYHRVSRNTARDALKQLAAAGLAISVRNAGYRVRELSIDDIRDLYRARRIIESGAILASATAPSALFGAVENCVCEAEACAGAGRWAQAGTWSLNFHRAIVGLAQSPTLDQFFLSTVAQLRLAFAIMPDEGSFQARWVGRDRAVAELILAASREDAVAELTRYLDDSETRVIDAVRAATRASTALAS